MFQSLIVALTAFVGLNCVGAANRKFYDEDTVNLNEFNGACVHILILSSLVILICGSIGYSYISEFLDIPVSWVFFAILVSITNVIIGLRLGQWQIRNKAKPYGVLQVGNSTLNLSLSCVFVILLSLGASGRIYALVIAGAIISIPSLYLLYKNNLLTLAKLNYKYLSEILAFGVPPCSSCVRFFFNNYRR